MMNVIINIFEALMELMIKVISMIVNIIETAGIAVGLTEHESHMLLVIAVGVSLGIQSAHSLERIRSREKDLEKAIKEADIDGMFNHITTKSLNNAAKAAEN